MYLFYILYNFIQNIFYNISYANLMFLMKTTKLSLIILLIILVLYNETNPPWYFLGDILIYNSRNYLIISLLALFISIYFIKTENFNKFFDENIILGFSTFLLISYFGYFSSSDITLLIFILFVLFSTLSFFIRIPKIIMINSHLFFLAVLLIFLFSNFDSKLFELSLNDRINQRLYIYINFFENINIFNLLIPISTVFSLETKTSSHSEILFIIYSQGLIGIFLFFIL